MLLFFLILFSLLSSFSCIPRQWESLPPLPVPLVYHSMVTSSTGLIVVYGGLRANFSQVDYISGDLYYLDLTQSPLSWTSQRYAQVGWPDPRYGHSACVDYQTNQMYVYGGCQIGPACWPWEGEIWVLDLNTITTQTNWSKIVFPPKDVNDDDPYGAIYGALAFRKNLLWLYLASDQQWDFNAGYFPGFIYAYNTTNSTWSYIDIGYWQDAPNFPQFPWGKHAYPVFGFGYDDQLVLYWGQEQPNGEPAWIWSVSVDDPAPEWTVRVIVPTTTPYPIGNTGFSVWKIHDINGGRTCLSPATCYLSIYSGYDFNENVTTSNFWTISIGTTAPITHDLINISNSRSLMGAAGTLTQDGQLLISGGSNLTAGREINSLFHVVDAVAQIPLSNPIDPTKTSLVCPSTLNAGTQQNCIILARDQDSIPTGSNVYASNFLVKLYWHQSVRDPWDDLGVMAVSYNSSTRQYFFPIGRTSTGFLLINISYSGVLMPSNTTQILPLAIDTQHTTISCPKSILLPGTIICPITANDSLLNPAGSANDTQRFNVTIGLPSKLCGVSSYIVQPIWSQTGTFIVQFTPPSEGSYTIYVEYQHQPIAPENPVTVTVLSSCPSFKAKSNDSDQCECVNGYELNKTTDNCSPCLLGYEKLDIGSEPCHCAPGFYNKSIYSSLHCVDPLGYTEFPALPHISQTGCYQCPSCVSCINGLASPVSGYWWRPSETIKDVKVYACSIYPEHSCIGGESSSICVAGFAGPLCSTCAEGYAGLECASCAETALSDFATSITILITFAFLACYLYYANSPMSPRALFQKVLVNHLQTLSLTSAFNLGWPAVARSVYRWIGIASVSNSQVFSGCSITFDLIAMLWAYVVIIAAVVFVWCSLKFLFRSYNLNPLDQNDQGDQKCMHYFRVYMCSFLALLVFLAPSCSQTIIAVLGPCLDINESKYLSADLSIQCLGQRYHSAYVVAWLFLAFFPVLVLLGCFLFLFKHYRELDANWIKCRFYFLYAGYQSKLWFWEFLIILRKMALVCIGSLTHNPVAQNILGLATLIASLCLHQNYLPLNGEFLNRLETASLALCTVMLLVSGLYNSKSQINVHFIDVISAAIVVLHLLFIVFLIFSIAKRLRQKEGRKAVPVQEAEMGTFSVSPSSLSQHTSEPSRHSASFEQPDTKTSEKVLLSNIKGNSANVETSELKEKRLSDSQSKAISLAPLDSSFQAKSGHGSLSHTQLQTPRSLLSPSINEPSRLTPRGPLAETATTEIPLLDSEIQGNPIQETTDETPDYVV